MLLLLTGSSGSGKTSVARECTDLDRLVVHDFDEVGVPVDADKAWRQRTLEHWVRRAIELQHNAVDLLLTAQSPLTELLAVPSAPLLDRWAVCLLDLTDEAERRRRLAGRDGDRWSEHALDAFAGWAAWHRRQATDPTHRLDVITDASWDQMAWDRLPRNAPEVTIIDTTGKPAATVLAEVRSWLTTQRRHRPE